MGASLEGDEKLLEPDNGDSCMTTKVLKATETFTFCELYFDK